MRINVYTYRETPYFDFDIDANSTGFSVMNFLMDLYAGYAKTALESGNYELAKEMCAETISIRAAIDDAKEKLATIESQRKADEDAETE